MLNLIRLDPSSIRDLSSEVLAAPGRPRILPAEFYKRTTMEERALVGNQHGIYSLPTLELVEWLKEQIGGRSAIEIGAGHGALAAALGIPATDSRLQEDPAIMQYYSMIRQPVVIYGDNVEKLDANAAVLKHKPQVVIASWVTHKYRENRHAAGGNALGVDEEAILESCDTYIFIGNTKVHQGKSIWSRPHRKFEPDWLFSRAHNGSPEFIGIWGR